MPTPEPTGVSSISRREAIRRAALLAGVVVSSEWLSIIGRARRRAQGRSLDAAQAAIVSAAADRILPRTDTPGAIDVGVPAFINLLYSDIMTAEERERLTSGLAAVDAAAKAATAGRSPRSAPIDRTRSCATSRAPKKRANQASSRCSDRPPSWGISRPRRSAATSSTTTRCRAGTTAASQSIRSAGATGRRRGCPQSEDNDVAGDRLSEAVGRPTNLDPITANANNAASAMASDTTVPERSRSATTESIAARSHRRRRSRASSETATRTR